MKIHCLSATFGRLQRETLALGDGLNIIQAPNEAGKSTWSAFLVAMLYGINSRERDRAGFIADKNRFAPWSGAAMRGRMDCMADGRELTIIRETRRQAAPMGTFSAVYAGTGDAVPDLTGQNCGEMLLGVSREVFERSAFIRQSGLAISQDAGLERRIAALITSGEEDISYSEAAEILKRQLNRRRHNKTGQIPALEAELAETEAQLAELTALGRQLTAVRTQMEDLTLRRQDLEAELRRWDLWDAAQARQARQAQADALVQAEARTAALRQELEAARIPENDAIGRLRGAIVNLETVRRGVDKAREDRDQAMRALLRAEAAVHESPFAGQSADSAHRDAQTPPVVQADRRSLFQGTAIRLTGVTLGAGAAMALLATAGPLTGALAAAPWGIFAVVTAASFYLAHLCRRRALTIARTAALTKRFGTADPAQIAALADAYCQDLTARDAAQAAVDTKSAAADALYASLSTNEQGILLEVRRFAPAAFDIPAADAALREAFGRRRALAEAEAQLRDAQTRCQLQGGANDDAPREDLPDGPPARSREDLSADLTAALAELSAARSAADRLTGQLHALGDPGVLGSRLSCLREQRDALEGEYQALQLAMEVLETSNTTMQSRFSPALGRRAAEIFSQLTAGRYSGVVLDRTFRLSAEPTGDAVYRDASLLSAGAADQLYLATRLAICGLVLPAEKTVPIVLDDALANFDDHRCAAALTWLRAEARHRQILLFTCHSREADFFAEDGEVYVQRLTEAGQRV